MIAAPPEIGNYLSGFAALERRRAGPSLPWLDAIRREAIERFADLGFPTTRHEDWQYTNLAPVAATAFRPAPPGRDALAPERVAELRCSEAECGQLVFVNGRHAPELSAPGSLPRGTVVGSLAAALEADPASLEPHLGRYARFGQRAMVALNTAFAEDGAYLSIPAASVLHRPIHLIFLSTAPGFPAASHPRNLIVVGADSQVTLVESHVGPAGQVYLANSVTEIVAGAGSVVDFTKLDEEGDGGFHVSTVQVRQEARSSFTSHAISLGGALVRNELNVELAGEGAECALFGLYLVSGRSHVDHHTTIDHARPHCSSREIYKGILDGRASAVFNGRIVVRRDAQKTSARQSNKNLLLSEHAVVNTKPQLEICADDVKCNHGATIGTLDPNALFYLRSRGIGHDDARNLLINAFGGEIIEGIKLKPIQCRLDLAVVTRLSRAHRMEEA